MTSSNISIRPITPRDIDARHRFWIELSYEQTGMIHTYDEVDVHVSETQDKINSFLRMRRGLWLIALNQQQQVIGEIDITIKNLIRIKHVGSLTIGILKAYQGQGIGSALMNAALEWAYTQGLKRIELYVFSSNIKAYNLYKKHGFIQEGVRKNYLRHDENIYEDDFLMARYF